MALVAHSAEEGAVAEECNQDAEDGIGGKKINSRQGRHSRRRLAPRKARLLRKATRLLRKATEMLRKASEPRKARAEEGASSGHRGLEPA